LCLSGFGWRARHCKTSSVVGLDVKNHQKIHPSKNSKWMMHSCCIAAWVRGGFSRFRSGVTRFTVFSPKFEWREATRDCGGLLFDIGNLGVRCQQKIRYELVPRRSPAISGHSNCPECVHPVSSAFRHAANCFSSIGTCAARARARATCSGRRSGISPGRGNAD